MMIMVLAFMKEYMSALLITSMISMTVDVAFPITANLVKMMFLEVVKLLVVAKRLAVIGFRARVTLLVVMFAVEAPERPLVAIVLALIICTPSANYICNHVELNSRSLGYCCNFLLLSSSDV